MNDNAKLGKTIKYYNPTKNKMENKIIKKKPGDLFDCDEYVCKKRAKQETRLVLTPAESCPASAS